MLPLCETPMTSLHLRDVLLLPRILGVLGVVAVAGQRLPLGRLVRLLEREPDGEAVRDVARLVRLTQGVLRRTHGRAFCYPRSLVLFHVLSGWGYPVALHLGIRKEAGAVEGHAWLDLAGEPLAEHQDPRSTYRVIQSYPSHSRRSPHAIHHS